MVRPSMICDSHGRHSSLINAFLVSTRNICYHWESAQSFCSKACPTQMMSLLWPNNCMHDYWSGQLHMSNTYIYCNVTGFAPDQTHLACVRASSSFTSSISCLTAWWFSFRQSPSDLAAFSFFISSFNWCSCLLWASTCSARLNKRAWL